MLASVQSLLMNAVFELRRNIISLQLYVAPGVIDEDLAGIRLIPSEKC